MTYFFKLVEKVLNDSMLSIDKDIKTLYQALDLLDDSSSKYIEVNQLLQKLIAKKISNMDLAVNGLKDGNDEYIIQPLGTAIPTSTDKMVVCAGIMFDSDDHTQPNGLHWKGIPRTRAGKHDKNHKGSQQITRATPHPRHNLRQQIKAIKRYQQ